MNLYERDLKALMSSDPEADERQLPASIIEAPRYDSSGRDVQEKTRKAEPIVRECLEENARKREDGRHKQQMRITDIHQYLKKEKGIKLSYSTVKRLVRKLEETKKEAFIHQEHSPGMDTEFDWGEVKLNIAGQGYKKYQMAVFASSYGNHRFAMLFRSQDTAAFQESHTEYFSFCGGVYRNVIYDNMKVAVRTFVGPTEKEPTRALLELSAYYGFGFRFCNVRRGNEKGHVERAVDAVRHFAFSGPGKDCFGSLQEANAYLLGKCREHNQEPLSDGRIPQEAFEEERPLLMAAPPVKMPCFAKKCRLRVDKYSTVSVNNVHYSVPDSLVGKRVDAWVYTGKVEIVRDGKTVASHERRYQQGEYVLDIFHYLHTLKRKPGALPQSSALLQSDATVKKLYEDYYSKEPKEFLPVLELIRDSGTGPVEDAVKKLAKICPHDLSAEKIRQFLKDGAKAEPDRRGCGQDQLSRKSKATLCYYDAAMDFQARRAG